MFNLGKGDHEGSEEIIERSVVLVKQIERIEDSEVKWKILAEFWAKMMLFMAPSDDETVYVEHLAIGGEFVTHLWALLFHVSILKHDPALDV